MKKQILITTLALGLAVPLLAQQPGSGTSGSRPGTSGSSSGTTGSGTTGTGAAGAAAGAAASMSHEQAFKQLDTNSDGNISKEEFRTGFPNLMSHGTGARGTGTGTTGSGAAGTGTTGSGTNGSSGRGNQR